MRQQAQDQERREAQKQASSAQQRSADATPAISVASNLPATPTQVPVEVLKVRPLYKISKYDQDIMSCVSLIMHSSVP